EKEGAADVGSDEDVVEHEEGNCQHCRDADDVQCIRERDEAPFRRGQIEDEEHDRAEGEEVGQNLEQEWQTVKETVTALEAQIEGDKQRRRGRQEVVERNQEIAQSEMRKTRHPPADEYPVRCNLTALIAHLVKTCQPRGR